MTHAKSDEGGYGLSDDHWIFEQLGSPVKLPSRHGTSSSQNANSPDIDKNVFSEKLRIYADNMRRLIITARKEIKELKQENTTLKRKLQASGLLECPACLFHFKPEREHRILPKYVKVFRGKLSLEIEFSTLHEMSEWLTLNQLDENSDGLPTMLQCGEQKLDLTSTGSLLHQLVSKKKEQETRRERVVISTRPRPAYSRDAQNSSYSPAAQHPPKPVSRKPVEVQKTTSVNKCHEGSWMSNGRVEEKCPNSSLCQQIMSSVPIDRQTESFEIKIENSAEQLPYTYCTTSAANRCSETSAVEMATRKQKLEYTSQTGDVLGHPESESRREYDCRQKEHSNSYHNNRRERNRSSEIERKEIRSSSLTQHCPSYDSRKNDSKSTSNAIETQESTRHAVYIDVKHRTSHNSTAEIEGTTSIVKKDEQNNKSRQGAEALGKENRGHQKNVDRKQPTNSQRRKTSPDVGKSAEDNEASSSQNPSSSSGHPRNTSRNKLKDSEKHPHKKERDLFRDATKHNVNDKGSHSVNSAESSRDCSGAFHRRRPAEEPRNGVRCRNLPVRRSPLKSSHRSQQDHIRHDVPNGRTEQIESKSSKKASRSYRSGTASSSKERSRHRRSPVRNEREEYGVSPKKRRMSTSSQEFGQEQEEESIISEEELVMVDEDEVEDGEIMD